MNYHTISVTIYSPLSMVFINENMDQKHRSGHRHGQGARMYGRQAIAHAGSLSSL